MRLLLTMALLVALTGPLLAGDGGLSGQQCTSFPTVSYSAPTKSTTVASSSFTVVPGLITQGTTYVVICPPPYFP